MSGVQPFTFLVLLLTGRCNLSCSYCFSRDSLPAVDMPLPTAMESIRRYVGDRNQATVEFAGGEPLLAFPLLKSIVERAETEYPRLRMAVQTNGTVSEEGVWEFLLEHHIGIGISLDGVPRVNDRQRGDTESVLKSLEMLQDGGAGVNITTVLTDDSAAGMRELLLLCARFDCVRTINLDILRPSANRQAGVPREAQIEEMVEVLFETLAYINRHRFPPLRVREIEQIYRGLRSTPGLPFCPAGLRQALAVTPGGRLYPCASLVGQDRFLLGTVSDEDFEKLGDLCCPTVYPEECLECPVLRACRGGCPSRRAAYNGSVREKSALECRLSRGIYRRYVHEKAG
jgi:uncharacterized protein